MSIPVCGRGLLDTDFVKRVSFKNSPFQGRSWLLQTLRLQGKPSPPKLAWVTIRVSDSWTLKCPLKVVTMYFWLYFWWGGDVISWKFQDTFPLPFWSWVYVFLMMRGRKLKFDNFDTYGSSPNKLLFLFVQPGSLLTHTPTSHQNLNELFVFWEWRTPIMGVPHTVMRIYVFSIFLWKCLST